MSPTPYFVYRSYPSIIFIGSICSGIFNPVYNWIRGPSCTLLYCTVAFGNFPYPPPPQKKKDGKISKPNFFQNMLSVCRSKQLKESEIYKCPALTALSNSIFWISSQSLEAGFGWTRELRAHMLRETQKFVHMYCRYFVDVGGFKTHLKKNFRQ